MEPFENRNAYQQRLDFHRFASAIWGQLARDAMGMLAKETFLSHRDHFEAFINRAVNRSLEHLREADAVRRCGHK